MRIILALAFFLAAASCSDQTNVADFSGLAAGNYRLEAVSTSSADESPSWLWCVGDYAWLVGDPTAGGKVVASGQSRCEVASSGLTAVNLAAGCQGERKAFTIAYDTRGQVTHREPFTYLCLQTGDLAETRDEFLVATDAGFVHVFVKEPIVRYHYRKTD